jgi:hypothetical protein
MMGSDIKCCDECVFWIARKDPSLAKFWMDICDIASKFGALFGLPYIHQEELRDLELLGFIETTDTKICILVKVKGKKEDTIGTYFCGGKCGN